MKTKTISLTKKEINWLAHLNERWLQDAEMWSKVMNSEECESMNAMKKMAEKINKKFSDYADNKD